jgi:hypothetical protein
MDVIDELGKVYGETMNKLKYELNELESESMSYEAQAHSEGSVARAIEEQTAKLPSDAYLWSAISAMSIALFLQMTGKKNASLFVGQWAAPFLIMGVYNKLVKVAGSDRVHP